MKQNIDKLLATCFIQPVEEATWLSPILVVPKNNGKLRICMDFRNLNVAIKNDPFPWPFTYEVLNTMARCEAYIHFLMDILAIIRYIHSFRKQIQDNVCHRLGNVYLEGDAFWNEEWTSNISKNCDENLWCHKKSWITMKICDTLLPNGMPCHHHMEDEVVINYKGQQYFQLTDKCD